MTLLPAPHGANTLSPAVIDTISAPDGIALITAGETLSKALARGEALDWSRLKSAMDDAFGASDRDGAWVWKDAYDAAELALVLFLDRFLPTMQRHAPDTAALMAMVCKVADLMPTHTKRSEESQAYQQFSTPAPLAALVGAAAAITADDAVLEPSAGTGLLAVFVKARGASLILNEYADIRARILRHVFPQTAVTQFDAANIHDYLPADAVPTVVVMNPPFSASPLMRGPVAGTDLTHLRSALQRLAPGGRLVAITGFNLHPHNPDVTAAFDALDGLATLRYSAGIAGHHFRKHGTTIATRISVYDKAPGRWQEARLHSAEMDSLDAILADLMCLPDRLVSRATPLPILSHRAAPLRQATDASVPVPVTGVELVYHDVPQTPLLGKADDALYQAYNPERILIPDAVAHPTKLVQSAAMASVMPPLPTYRPRLPERLVANGLLSAPQLESVIYAGEAHSKYLPGHWTVADTLYTLTAAATDTAQAVQFRRGWFLGDGTGAGKGRQVAGIVLDNWLNGRRKAVWISKSDKLLEDAQRDWSALGQEKLMIVPQSRFGQGKPIRLTQGILFTTYATLRSAERGGKASRLQQILDWLGPNWDGVIVFDEAHAMANAASSGGERGIKSASQQGVAGLKLQHALPHARVVYVSATGATTVENLAYAQRLGLWGNQDLPFENREAFVASMLSGGIAANEVLARDLKSMGLYMARSLSYEGVHVDLLDHTLTPDQIAIYDAYAGAYHIIHTHLEAAMQAANITGDKATYNRAAKSAARSAFEGCKQRFFAHLITAMKMPTLLKAIQGDLDAGRAVIVQLISTSEALMERRLAEVPPAEWNDLTCDVTPREYVLDYLKHSFPTQLYETHTDDDGNISSTPVYHEGRVVECRDAVARRDALIEHLAALPPVQAALDQLIHHFGVDRVAEVTGRSRRIIRADGPQGPVLKVQNRPATANLGETSAFMDDVKPILVFSDAGGTGRSYHADLACKNQRPRVHYLLEAGWKADTAIQGLGRSNRTNQKQPPLFRPVATDVRGEKRFLSTIARRLDSLGAITRGQRQTGGQGMFRSSDNLESMYARSALRHFYQLLYAGKVSCISLLEFQNATGLILSDGDGTLKEDLPPISTFLNRMLALPIARQNALFDAFEELIMSRIESAIAAGTYDLGLETIRAESLTIADRITIATHAGTGASTSLLTIHRKDKLAPLALNDVLLQAKRDHGVFLVNSKSGRAALQVQAPSLTLDDGTLEQRVRLVRPLDRASVPVAAMSDSHWERCDADTFARHWTDELSQLPVYAETTFHVMTGLLLPLWKRLPDDNMRVYRFTTDAGEAVLGRLIPSHLVSTFATSQAAVSADDAWALLASGDPVPLTPPMQVRPATVMHSRRFELVGFTSEQVPVLKAMGLFSELIAWRLRLFVPAGEGGPAVLGALLARYGKQVVQKEAA